MHQMTAAIKHIEGWQSFHSYCSASYVKVRLKSVVPRQDIIHNI
jgi:hypothetical protein